MVNQEVFWKIFPNAILRILGRDTGEFLENFSKKKFLLSYDVSMDDNWNESRGINRWRAGAPRHDITVNLVNNLFQIFEFKIDHIEKSGW